MIFLAPKNKKKTKFGRPLIGGGVATGQCQCSNYSGPKGAQFSGVARKFFLGANACLECLDDGQSHSGNLVKEEAEDFPYK